MQNLLQFIAGLGLFMYAMFLLEDSLRSLAGRSFKLFLRKHTTNTLEAIGSSALITTIVQSSSIVNMTILAFVGAGIVSMRNALAVVLGSNFGTTISNWIVATVGFEFDISYVAMPFIGIAALMLVFVHSEKKIHHVGRFILGFGFIFLGLEFMKESMSAVLEGFDYTEYEGYPTIVFVLIGFILTALIQSSSASMAIFLSALYTGSIPLETTAAAVLGSEVGTTLKVVFGSMRGIAPKKQLAAANIIFNLTTCLLAFIFLTPLLNMTKWIVGENESLLRLVAFQSIINIGGIVIFAPFLNPFARFLERKIHGTVTPATFMIGKETLGAPELARDAMEQDTNLLLHRILRLNLEAFAVEKRIIHSAPDIDVTLKERNRKLDTYEKRYDDLKRAEGEVLAYALQVQQKFPEQAGRINELLAAVRYAMHSAKAMKDVRHNRIEFHESADNIKYRYYTDFRKQLEEFYAGVDKVMQSELRTTHGRFDGLLQTANDDYFKRQEKIYEAARHGKLEKGDISSLLNVNRELYTSAKTIVLALRLYYAGDHHPRMFEEFP